MSIDHRGLNVLVTEDLAHSSRIEKSHKAGSSPIQLTSQFRRNYYRKMIELISKVV